MRNTRPDIEKVGVALAERIRETRALCGLSQEALAVRVGVSRVAVSQWETGTTAPTLERIEAISRALGVNPAQLLETPAPRAVRSSRLTVAEAGLPRNLPVRRTVPRPPCYENFRLLAVGAADFVHRPAILAGVDEAYGLYVPDSCMEPRFFPGELVLIHPGRPALPGDFVVVFTREEEEPEPCACCRRFLGRRGGEMEFALFHPAETRILSARQITAVHRILTTGDLCGAR